MKPSLISKSTLITLLVLLMLVGAQNISPDSPTCTNDDDCSYPFGSCFENICIHKNIFPIEWQEILGAGIIFIIIAFGNAVGIHGNAVVITVGTTLFFLTLRQAIPIGLFTVAVAMIVAYLLNFNDKHPLKDATMIDYGIVQSQMPLLELGILFGVELNELIPETAIFIILCIVLALATIQSFLLAIETSRTEERVLLERKEISVDRRVEAMLRKQERIGQITGKK